MASLVQARAVSGRQSPIRLEDLNRAALPGLYAARTRDLEMQQIGLAEAGLRQRQREADLMNRQANLGLITQGAGTAVQGAMTAELVSPGILGRAGQALGLTRAAPAVAAGVAPTVGTLAGSTALPGGTGVAAAYPLFGGATSAALPAASSVPSGAATASGLTGSLSAAAPTAAAGGSTAAGTGATTALGALGGIAAPAGAGFAAGAIGGRLGNVLLPFGGETGEKIERGIGGAGVGAAAGALIGGPIGAVVGGIGGLIGGTLGDVSVIATAVNGIHHPDTQLALQFRLRYLEWHEYRGYRKLFDPVARWIRRHPGSKPLMRVLLVNWAIRAMRAELDDAPWARHLVSRLALKGMIGLCGWIGRSKRNRRYGSNERRNRLRCEAGTEPLRPME